MNKYSNFQIYILFLNIVGRSHHWSQCIKMLGKDLQLKTTTVVVFFLCSVKSLRNLYVIGLLITYRSVALFLISDMVLGIRDQLQIF